MDSRLKDRARVHAALADPNRLAIVDQLALSDRSPTELGAQLGMPTNLLAHHLEVLEAAALVERFVSTGDRRRRYVRLRRSPLDAADVPAARATGSVLFVCTHNAARSQLAAALWTKYHTGAAESAGTDPAPRVHPGAVAAARRAGLEIGDAVPTVLTDASGADTVVTVCDRAHEELVPPSDWWHWSIPDPSRVGTDAAFDAVVADLDSRIRSLA